MAKTYWEKLKDPRWQKKRLEALQASDFACEVCYNDEQTLHVHHKEYFKGREPWDYEVSQLAVLCEVCHAEQHESDDPLKVVCSFLPLDGPYSRSNVAAFVAGLAGQDMPPNFEVEYFAGFAADNILRTYTTDLETMRRIASMARHYGGDLLQLLMSFSPPEEASK
jgi:hypothetical protein